MVGTWELTDYEDPTNDYQYDDVEGTFIIYNNDTYDLDMIYSLVGGGEIKIIDTGTCKACHVNKLLQTFSNKDENYDRNNRYILSGKQLILESDQDNILMTFQKVD